MIRMSMILAAACLLASLSYSAALAHCGTCGVGEPAVHGELHDHTATAAAGATAEAAETAALPEGHIMTMPLECPGGCGMAGGLCNGCRPVAEDILRQIAVDFCPDCDEKDALCEICEGAVNGALDRLTDGVAASVMSAPAHTVAYVGGTLGGDIQAQWGQLMEAAGAQQLFGPHTMVGGVIPTALSGEGFGPHTTYYAAVSVEPGTEVAEPLALYEVPAGVFLVVDHVGPYEELPASWMATFAYVKLQGIELGTGPCGEHYISDPETTPSEELLTQLFVPVVGHTDGRGEMPAEGADPHAGHGHS